MPAELLAKDLGEQVRMVNPSCCRPIRRTIVSWMSETVETMRATEALKAKNTLGTLSDRVAEGEESLITRRGKPVARWVPDNGFADREKARRAAADILQMSTGVTLGDIALRDMIDGGRRWA